MQTLSRRNWLGLVFLSETTQARLREKKTAQKEGECDSSVANGVALTVQSSSTERRQCSSDFNHRFFGRTRCVSHDVQCVKVYLGSSKSVWTTTPGWLLRGPELSTLLFSGVEGLTMHQPSSPQCST